MSNFCRKFGYSSKLKRMRNTIKGNVYPPVYNERKWNSNHMNCYAYAIDVPLRDLEEDFLIPGCISDPEAETVIFSDVEGLFKKDLKFLGFSIRKDDTVLAEGDYRIAIYMGASFHDYPVGFHFIRQDSDGTWSDKPGWKGKPQKYEKGQVPNLEKHNLYLREVIIVKKFD